MNRTLRAVVLVFAAAALAAGPASGRQSEPDQARPDRGDDMSVVRVTATGTVAGEPDTAIVIVGTRTEAAEAAGALDENSRRMAALTAALRDAGIAERDIQTHDLRLTPRYDQVDGRRRPAGYEVVNTVRIRVRDLAGLGGVLDAAVRSGGNVVENLVFAFDDPEALLDEARAKAVAEARRKAAALVGLAGAELGPLRSIGEAERLPGPEPRVAVMSLEAADVPVQPGTLSVAVTVQAEWFIRMTG